MLTLVGRIVAGSGAAAEETAMAAPMSGDAARFCANIGDAANDARVAWEARTLKELKSEVEEKTAALEAKRAELADLVKKRDAFREMAEKAVVDIYAKMRPDAAAAQLSVVDPETAAAVLAKLKARVAGAILAEMDAPRAATLASLISAGGASEKEARRANP
jgi:flagellar motility protein MotE (MotC chaperone)